MDQKPQTGARQFDKYHRLPIVKILQFLVPLSFLSVLLLSYYSFDFHFSTLLFPFFIQTLERKYMFLICNAILAFLAKDSCFTGSDDFNSDNGEDVKPVVSSKVATRSSSSIQTLHNVEVREAEEQVNTSLKKETKETQNGTSVMESDYEDNENEVDQNIDELNKEVEESDFDGGDESEESGTLIVEDNGNEVDMNIDELNRKFDDFIRKVKEEIRIEARRQLICV